MKMYKPIIFVLGLLMLTTFLAACGNAGASAGQNPQGQAGQAPISTQDVIRTDYPNALPVVTQLALGMFKLDDGNTSLSKDQAVALLPLWKAYRNLTSSDTSSSEEINALIAQIQETLSTDQLKNIAAMQLTGQDLAQLAQQRNLTLGGGQGFNLSPEQQATRQALRSSGQTRGGEGGFRFGEGGGGGFAPGGGGFGPPPGLAETPGALQTAIARRGGATGQDRINPALVEALIAFLNTKAQ